MTLQAQLAKLSPGDLERYRRDKALFGSMFAQSVAWAPPAVGSLRALHFATTSVPRGLPLPQNSDGPGAFATGAVILRQGARGTNSLTV